MAIDGPITIKGDSVVSAYAEQTGDPKGGRAAGICSVDGNIIIEGDAIVTADAVSKSAAAAGIYSEYGDVEITSDGKVTATGKSQSGGADENQGLGIAAGEGVEITGTTVNAAGTSASGESAGIAAAVPGDNTNFNNAGGISIGSGSNVTAQGFGSEGHGIVVEGSGDAEIASGATVTAVARGAGYAIDANTIKNNGTATLKADDETHYSNGTITGSGSIAKSLNTPPASGGGGCDAGFGLFAALFALGMFRINRRKRT
jgi:hypothetical protein